jgi:hypothetical protein
VLGKLKTVQIQEKFSTINHAYELIERKDRSILTLKEERGDKERKTVKPWDSINSKGFPKQKLQE